jgi:Arc/MetJ family transcription regulator
MGRTNIVIDDELVGIVMERYKLKTKTAAIDKALRHLAGQPLTTEEILAFEGANLIGEVPEDRFEHDPH